MTAVHSFEVGEHTVKIYHDADVECPVSGQEAVKLVVLHGRYTDPAKGSCGSSPDAVERWVKRHPAWFAIPLWLYDHSGTVYRAGAHNPFQCQWDSGRVGIAAVRRREHGKTDEACLKAIQSYVDEYSDWANGECFYYVIEDAAGEEVDSCGGYIGLDAAEQAAKDALRVPVSAE